MIAIAINYSTLTYIAENFSDGEILTPAVEDVEFSNGEDTYYIVRPDAPNLKVTCNEFWDEWWDKTGMPICIPPK